MAEFERVMSVSDLAPGACRTVKVGGKTVAVYNVGGTFHATSNACLHRGAPLGEGFLDGEAVICPWHSWSWNVRTGKNTDNPDMRIATYEVKVAGDDVLVRIEP